MLQKRGEPRRFTDGEFCCVVRFLLQQFELSFIPAALISIVSEKGLSIEKHASGFNVEGENSREGVFELFARETE